MDKFRIEYNAGSVSGLHIAYNVISEEHERRLFLADHLYQQTIGAAQQAPNSEGLISPLAWEVFNLARDCQFAKHMMLPDVTANNSYNAARFYGQVGIPFHFDDERFGEFVLGISLGMEAELRMLYDPPDLTKPWQPPVARADFGKGSIFSAEEAAYERKPRPPGMAGTGPVILTLPRRSMYILSGDARSKWKHSIYSTGHTPPGQPPVELPSWNLIGARRSITLRSSKMFEIVCMQRAIAACTASEEEKRAILEMRLESQMKEIDRLPAFLQSNFSLDEAAFWWEKLEALEKSEKCEQRLRVDEVLPEVLAAMDAPTRKLYECPFSSDEEKKAYVGKHGTFRGLFGAVRGGSFGAGGSSAAAVEGGSQEVIDRQFLQKAVVDSLAVGSQEVIEQQFVQQAVLESLENVEEKGVEEAKQESLKAVAEEAAKREAFKKKEEEELEQAMKASLAAVNGSRLRKEGEGAQGEAEVIDLTFDDDDD